MTEDSFDLIEGSIERALDSLIATQQHLKHQSSMPQRFRITEANDDDMEADLKILKPQILKYEKALEQFRASKRLLTTGTN